MKTVKATAVILVATENTTPLAVEYDDDRKKVTCTSADGEECTERPLQIYDSAPLVARAVDTAREAVQGGVCAPLSSLRKATFASAGRHESPIGYKWNERACAHWREAGDQRRATLG